MTTLDAKVVAVGAAVTCGLVAIVVLGFVCLFRYGIGSFVAAQAVAAVAVALVTELFVPWASRRRRRRAPL